MKNRRLGKFLSESEVSAHFTTKIIEKLYALTFDSCNVCDCDMYLHTAYQYNLSKNSCN